MLRTDGETVDEFGPWTLAEYPAETRDLLAEALAAGLAWQFEGPEPAVFRAAEDALTRAQSAAVSAFLAENGIAPAEVAAIGFHGQTVLHRAPKPGRIGDTRQLGDGALMAALTGIDVVHDFRTDDVRAGGQGAPLSASYHAALLRRAGLPASTAVLNLGGVANVTGAARTANSSPSTPARPMRRSTTGSSAPPASGWIAMDGWRARAGSTNPGWPGCSSIPTSPPPTRNRWIASTSRPVWRRLSLEDGAATLTAFTAGAVGRGLDRLPQRPTRLVVCGGGRRNRR